MYKYPGFYNFRVRYVYDYEMVVEYPYKHAGVWVKDATHYQERLNTVKQDYLTKGELVVDGKVTD